MEKKILKRREKVSLNPTKKNIWVLAIYQIRTVYPTNLSLHLRSLYTYLDMYLVAKS